MTKYTLKKDKYSSHAKIISFLKKDSGSRKVAILDVACSKGFLAKALQHPSKQWYGIELDKEDISVAKPYYQEIKNIDLEKDNFSYQKDFFDYIILGDIIEHLKDPHYLIKKLKPFLKKNGIMIISVPNVANMYVRLKLLMGNFDYEHRGIMDNTHLKFFTRKTIHAFAKHTGLKVIKEDTTPIPLPLASGLFEQGRGLYPLHVFNNLIKNMRPTMFGYQFILYCKKR